ncbi:hypothetical protein [Streptomyces sp. MI02-7b]|uniref:hypothetical protein n=1 Tax=Streptomyces sp. MI02-7b TaxID=462941 RepID=UPI0029A5B180|nr:hypothetical protein [Streptomyces sp. MI02-7b]MDX3077874.1 hypothetical protein [Streptomyces sp. MI02-7b]
MRPEDFFVGTPTSWGGLGPLKVDVLEALRFGPTADISDLDAALALTQLLHEDFVAKGTGGGERMNDEEVTIAIKGHRALLQRLAVAPPDFPFKDFTGFHNYWRRNGMSGGGGWQARREYVEDLLGPVRAALDKLQDLEYEQRLRMGPGGQFKNLIFAADGPKPRIVLRDAVNNDVEVVQNAENCLVYDEALPAYGLTWRQMVDWWIRKHQPGADEPEAARNLYGRLAASLDSHPERLVFRAYCARYRQPDGFDLPALIPQVYLHYDPYTRQSPHHAVALARQRMDFLLLAPDRSRIVIEVDGVQHYSQPRRLPGLDAPVHVASPQLYSEMVAEDRRLQLAGYEIHRFGGWELNRPQAAQMLEEFFTDLLQRHQRPVLP